MKSKYTCDNEDILIEAKEEILKLGCCDCGLIHKIEFEIEKKKYVRIKMKRDNRSTGQYRRHNFEYVKIS